MTLHVRLLTAVGLALLAAGIALGFVPAVSDGAKCGAPFAPAAAGLRSDICTASLAGPRTPAVGLVQVGAALGAAAFGVHIADQPRLRAQ